jgi:DNA-binding NarL/FixJ family response regulator
VEILLSIQGRLHGEAVERTFRSTQGMEIVGSEPVRSRLPGAVLRLKPRVLLLDLGRELLPGLEVATQVALDSPGTIVVGLLPPLQPGNVELLVRSGIACFEHQDADARDVIEAIRRLAAGHCPHIVGSSWCLHSLQVLCDPRPLSDPRVPLSGREKEVLHLLIRGCTSREMGARLFISPRTVEDHVASLFLKLRLHDKRALTCAHFGIEDAAALAVRSFDSLTCDCRFQ